MHRKISRRSATANISASLTLLALAAIGCVYKADLLRQFFVQNIYLNGIIIGVFFIGVLYALVHLFRINNEFLSLEKIRARFEVEIGEDESWLTTDVLERWPHSLTTERLSLYASQQERSCPLDNSSHVDKIDMSLDLHTDVTKYLASLMVFLGLLGTFIGLLISISGIEGMIGEISRSASSDGIAFLDELLAQITVPLKGMGTAFSTSVFGMVTSLFLGFLHLQLGAAQSRFSTRLEELDAALFLPIFQQMAGVLMPQSVAGAPQSGSGEMFARYMEASQRQLKDNLGRLVDIVERTESMQANYREAMQTIARGIEATNTAIVRLSTNQDLVRDSLRESAEAARLDTDNQRLMLGELKSLNDSMARMISAETASASATKEYHDDTLRALRRELGAFDKLTK